MVSMECSICFNEFREPRILSCGHTFCLRCIEDWTRESRTLKCPQCRRIHPGFTTAAALPRHDTANDLMGKLQLSAANASVGAAANSSILNNHENTNRTICKECGRDRTIDNLLFCTNHSVCVCPKCCQLKHTQCNMVDATEHACNVLLADKASLENAQCVLDKSAKRLAQEINHSVARLKQWVDVLNKAYALYERTGQLIQNRLRDLGKEVSNNRELLTKVLTIKENAAALLYSGDWTNVNQLVVKCAVYAEVNLQNVAGFAEDNIVRRWSTLQLWPNGRILQVIGRKLTRNQEIMFIGKHDKSTLPVLDDELANININELLQQIEDKLDRMQREAQTGESVNYSTASIMKPSFYVLREDTCDFSKLNGSHSAWMKLPPMPELKRRGFTVAACADKMYVIGGDETSTENASNIVQQFNTQTGWQNSPAMLEQRRSYCGAAALGDRLFVVGGSDGNVALSSAEECDLETGRWAHVAPMTAARYALGVAALDNLLFAVGGSSDSCLNTAEWYDPREGRWTKAAPMHVPRSAFGCAAMGDRLYVAGGWTDSEHCTASVEWFDFRAGRWTCVRHMGASRASFALAALNHQLLAAGGSGANWGRELDTVEAYEEKRDAWSTLDVRLPWKGGFAGCVAEA